MCVRGTISEEGDPVMVFEEEGKGVEMIVWAKEEMSVDSH